jgi:hypothetical protein
MGSQLQGGFCLTKIVLENRKTLKTLQAHALNWWFCLTKHTCLAVAFVTGRAKDADQFTNFESIRIYW